MTLNPLKSLLAALLAFYIIPSPIFAEEVPPHKTNEERLELFMKPNEWFVERLKNPPEYIDGGYLHPKIQYWQEIRGRSEGAEEAVRKYRERFLTEEHRAAARKQIDDSWIYRTIESAPMKSVEDRMIPGPGGELKIRIYVPETEEKGLLPVMVHYHGGAWIFGSIEAVDRSNRFFANEADIIVVAVDYRLAPEHKFPAPQDDALATFRWVLENAESFGGDPARTGVGGDSAGSQLSVVTAMRQWEDGKVLPAAIALFYPSVDMRLDRYSSFAMMNEGYGLNKGTSNFARSLMFNKYEDRHHRS